MQSEEGGVKFKLNQERVTILHNMRRPSVQALSLTRMNNQVILILNFSPFGIIP